MFSRRNKSASVAPSAPVVPVPPAFSYGGEPDMRGLGQALWRRKGRIVAVTLMAAAAAFAVVNAMAPRYRSEARILLETKENVFMRAVADKLADRPALDAEAVTSQLQILLSRDLARDIIRKHKLSENPEFDPLVGGLSITRTVMGLLGLARDPGSMSPEERTLESFYDHLNAFAVEKSRVIAVSFYSSNPELAAQIANSIAEAYLGMQQNAKQQQTRAASQWLSGEIANMRTKVAESESKIAAYRAQANLFVGSNNVSLSSQQLSEINSQISAARGQKADLEARARQLRELLRSGTSIDSSDIANSESIRRLSEQRAAFRAQLAEQSSTLLDQHPRIKELRAQIGELDRQIRTEAERLVRQFDSDAKVAGNRVETLTASLDQAKSAANQVNEQDVHLRELERESKAQRDLLESYLANYREASARENINAAPPEARIISRATASLKPDFPKKVPTILIAAFAAFALSAGFVVTGQLLNSSPMPAGYPQFASQIAPEFGAAMVRPSFAPPVSPQQVMPHAMTAAMAPDPHAPVEPRMAAPPLQPAQYVEPAMPLLGAVDDVAAALYRAGENGRRVAIFGAGRNVGTTYTAIALARALSAQASVVLVDLAVMSPNLAVISSNPNAPGLAELLSGNASFGDIITTDQYSNVHIIGTGEVGGDGMALLESGELATAIDALAQSYQFVVIDAGSATETPAEYLAAVASYAVLVTPETAVQAAQGLFQHIHAAGIPSAVMMASGAPLAQVA